MYRGAAAISPQTKRRIYMANRNYNRVQALEKEAKHLYAKVSIGSSGAPTLSRKLGVASIVRDNTGLYTLTLQDAYNDLLSIDIKQLVASAQDLNFQLIAEDVDNAKTIQFRCITATTATDPSSGSVLYIHIVLKNSAV